MFMLHCLVTILCTDVEKLPEEIKKWAASVEGVEAKLWQGVGRKVHTLILDYACHNTSSLII
ncbi:hypothetical protein Lalb_Chr09g0330981 [Lupinus albus]|uniref:Uncharacterized protein n=1 Tax=Lupinus albus TaxID=3870 RepID=A0A6A4Q130_LUPAL|nr:hypothetical protein Lalb_Chr09g0330981 [Lupinus albus]